MFQPIAGRVYRMSPKAVASVRPNGYKSNGQPFYLVDQEDMQLVKVINVRNGYFDVHYIIDGVETFYGKQWSTTEVGADWFMEA